VREKIAEYFRGWYARIPGSEVLVRPTREVSLPGLEAYRAERRSSSKTHQESNVVFYDAARAEIFVGDTFNDPERSASNRPFEAARDLPNIEASLRELFGLPVKIALKPGSRGVLLPLTVSIRQDKDEDAFALRDGFVSKDGSTLLLGEFHPIRESVSAFREKVLAQSEGVRKEKGGFLVTEFLDFQCERCRVRTPAVRQAVAARGGAIDVRFLPLVKMHDWAFAAAESGAALAAVKPGLYRRFEESIFERAEEMSAGAARELAADIAEAAGEREAYARELSSGRARERVVRDISLSLRLGIMETPSFIYRGALLPGERDALEVYLWESHPGPARRTPGRTE
jgi:hypothetical protein